MEYKKHLPSLDDALEESRRLRVIDFAHTESRCQVIVLAKEIERLQKVVADQALTIATLKDELGKYEPTIAKMREEFADCFKRLERAHDEADKYQFRALDAEKQAQTSRLALDVALKEVEHTKRCVSALMTYANITPAQYELICGKPGAPSRDQR